MPCTVLTFFTSLSPKQTRRVAEALSGFEERAGEIDELYEPRQTVIFEKDNRMRSADEDDVSLSVNAPLAADDHG